MRRTLLHFGMLAVALTAGVLFYPATYYINGWPLDGREANMQAAHAFLLIGGAVFTRPARFAESIGGRSAWTAFALGTVLAELGLIAAFGAFGRALTAPQCFPIIIFAAGLYARVAVRPAPISRQPRPRTRKPSRLVVVHQPAPEDIR